MNMSSGVYLKQINRHPGVHLRSASAAHGRRLLDLCCGGGLAAWGYWRSGRFSEIVGIDHEDMPYAFDFIKADAYALDYDFLLQFDFVHASPPCQYYSKVTPDRSKHFRSIPPMRHMLFAAGIPHVIENVEGSGHDLKPNIILTGRDVGLPMSRTRLFNCSFLSIDRASQIMSSLASNDLKLAPGANVQVHGGEATRDDLVRAFGLEVLSTRSLANLTIPHIKQGIPPAFTKFIAELYTPEKVMWG